MYVCVKASTNDTSYSNYSFYETHCNVAERIARISKEMGVERFVQLSALNASKDPVEKHLIPGALLGNVLICNGYCVNTGGSHWLRSKAAGEEAVRSHFPNAVIVRPASVFGEDDSFTLQFLGNCKSHVLYALETHSVHYSPQLSVRCVRVLRGRRGV